LPAVQSKLALLDCANPVNRGGLVLGRRIKAAMAPKSVAGVCRRHCLFYRDVQLARPAWRFVSKLFFPQPFVFVVDLSCCLLRLLGMGHRISATTNVHRLMAKSADRVYRSVRVGYARVGPRLAVYRFWLEWSRRRASCAISADSNRRVYRSRGAFIRGFVRKHHHRDDATAPVCGSEITPDTSAF